MARDKTHVTLGSGRLYFDDTEIGYLDGDVTLSIVREKIDFKPAGVIGAVTQFVTGEVVELRASFAELNVNKLKVALGLTTTISSFTSAPSYNPASFEGATATTSFAALTFGGSRAVDDDVAIRFEHTRPKTSEKFVVVLYKAISLSELSIDFHKEEITIMDIVFRGMVDDTRTAGDQIGMLIQEQLTQA